MYTRNQALCLTDLDATRLRALIEGYRQTSRRDLSAVLRLEQELGRADTVSRRAVGPDVVTMNSKVRVQDLRTKERSEFTVVFPRAVDHDLGRLSVLAPLGMAVIGARVGDVIEWRTPGGVRRLRVEAVTSQPEREGRFEL